MDTFHDCRRCHGPYRYFPKLGYELCEDCGHIRRNKPAPAIAEEPTCERCGGRYMSFPNLGIEVCRDPVCGHKRSIHHSSTQT